MTDNQLNLLSSIIEQFYSQVPEQELVKLSRAPHFDRVKDYVPAVYSKILSSINQGVFDHLKTHHLDRVEYFAELILEMIYAKKVSIDIVVKDRYTYWKNWKVQRINLKLKDKHQTS